MLQKQPGTWSTSGTSRCHRRYHREEAQGRVPSARSRQPTMVGEGWMKIFSTNSSLVESSKKVKVEGKPPATLFPSAKSTISKLPSFKKAPKVQEIPGGHTQAPAQEGKSSTRASPQQAPPSAAASRATPVNKQNPFADSLAMMSQEHQKKLPTFNDHPARPPPGQREQREQEKRAAESAADSAKKANSKSVRWMPERELVSVRWIESRAEQDDVSSLWSVLLSGMLTQRSTTNTSATLSNSK